MWHGLTFHKRTRPRSWIYGEDGHFIWAHRYLFLWHGLHQGICKIYNYILPSLLFGHRFCITFVAVFMISSQSHIYFPLLLCTFPAQALSNLVTPRQGWMVCKFYSEWERSNPCWALCVPWRVLCGEVLQVWFKELEIQSVRCCAAVSGDLLMPSLSFQPPVYFQYFFSYLFTKPLLTSSPGRYGLF